MKFNKRWLASLLVPEADRSERRAAEDFVCYRWDGSGVKEEAIRDISSTGVFVLTAERWAPGTTIWMTLQKRGPLAVSSERRMTIQATAARLGEDGVGLSFHSPTDPEGQAWERLVERVAEQTKVHDLLGLVRTAEAIGFLCQLCPGANEVTELLSVRLSNLRVQRAIEILLNAQNLVRPEANARALHAPPLIVERILENGSSVEEDWLREYWATLLAGSCTADGREVSRLPFVESLSQLLPAHVRILKHACTQATKARSAAGPVCSVPLLCPMEELMGITGLREIPTQHNIGQLAELGLLEKRERSRTALEAETLDVSPSSLGLQTYARWCDHKATPEAYYGLEPA